MTAMFSRWWRTDQHDWLSGYLSARGISGATRAFTSLFATSTRGNIGGGGDGRVVIWDGIALVPPLSTRLDGVTSRAIHASLQLGSSVSIAALPP